MKVSMHTAGLCLRPLWTSSSISIRISGDAPQSISSASWKVLPVLTNTATALTGTFSGIKRSTDAGPWSYFSIRNLGHVSTTAMDLTLDLTNTTANPSVNLEWCDGFTWDEVSNTCNGANAGTVIMSADKKGSTNYTWNKVIPVNGSIRVRLQRIGNGSTNATFSIAIPRSYVRAALSTQN